MNKQIEQTMFTKLGLALTKKKLEAARRIRAVHEVMDGKHSIVFKDHYLVVPFCEMSSYLKKGYVVVE